MMTIITNIPIIMTFLIFSYYIYMIYIMKMNKLMNNFIIKNVFILYI